MLKDYIDSVMKSGQITASELGHLRGALLYVNRTTVSTASASVLGYVLLKEFIRSALDQALIDPGFADALMNNLQNDIHKALDAIPAT